MSGLASRGRLLRDRIAPTSHELRPLRWGVGLAWIAWATGCGSLGGSAPGHPTSAADPTGSAAASTSGPATASGPGPATSASPPGSAGAHGPQPPAATSVAPLDVASALQCVATRVTSMPLELEPVDAAVVVLSSEALGPEDGWAAWQLWHKEGPPCGLTPLIVPALADQADGEPAACEGPCGGKLVAVAAERLQQARAALASTTAAAVLGEREQIRVELQREHNEWLERARAGTITDPDDAQAARCHRTPEQCPPDREMDEQRASLSTLGDAVDELAAAPAAPSWAFLRDPGNPNAPEEGASPVRLLLVAAEPWLLPAVVGFGGWNDCPSDAVHAVVLRDWHARFGAELVYLDRDTLELWVERPVRSAAELRRIAWEQYLYCSDIVAQGTGTVGELAQSITGRSWFFWWD